jgi:hypothetical protein
VQYSTGGDGGVKRRVTLHVLFFGSCFKGLGTNGGGSKFCNPCTPPPMHAHTRTRITHTRTHHAHHAHARALCARQLDTFGMISESEFVGSDRTSDIRSLKI